MRRVLTELCATQPDLSCFVSRQGIGHPEQVGQLHLLPYVDPPTVLPHAEWTICHGGQNTIIESLLFGVPLLMFPEPIFERRFNARQVTQAGAGLMGEREDFTVEWLTTSMKAQRQARSAAERLGDRICSYRGAAGAVDTMTKTWRQCSGSRRPHRSATNVLSCRDPDARTAGPSSPGNQRLRPTAGGRPTWTLHRVATSDS